MAAVSSGQIVQFCREHKARQKRRHRAEHQIGELSKKPGRKRKKPFIELCAKSCAAFKKARKSRAKAGTHAVRKFVRDGVESVLQGLCGPFQPPGQLRQLMEKTTDLPAKEPAQKEKPRPRQRVDPQHAQKRSKSPGKLRPALQCANRPPRHRRHREADEKRQQQRKQNRRKQPQPARRTDGDQHDRSKLSCAHTEGLLSCNFF